MLKPETDLTTNAHETAFIAFGEYFLMKSARLILKSGIYIPQKGKTSVNKRF